MERKAAAEYDPQLLKLYDRYVHGDIDRLQFLDDAATKLAWDRTISFFCRNVESRIMADSKRDGGIISMRRGVLLIFVLGTIGLGTELLLLDHFEEWRQQVPLVLLALGLILLAARMFYRGAIILRLFRWTMLAFVLGGMVGPLVPS